MIKEVVNMSSACMSACAVALASKLLVVVLCKCARPCMLPDSVHHQTRGST
jgi:hypothetical protein